MAAGPLQNPHTVCGTVFDRSTDFVTWCPNLAVAWYMTSPLKRMFACQQPDMTSEDTDLGLRYTQRSAGFF